MVRSFGDALRRIGILKEEKIESLFSTGWSRRDLSELPRKSHFSGEHPIVNCLMKGLDR